MEEQTPLIIHKQTLPFLNLSLYLNGFKPVRYLRVENTLERDTSGIEIKITADLPCIEPFNYTVPLIPAKKDILVPLENLKVNRDFLNKISETEKANISIEVTEEGGGNCTETFQVHIHPIEYFGGFQVLPELIVAYITPNLPYVYHIKRKAVEILEKQGLRTAFEGYQSNDPERVLQFMSAIYTAIQAEEIVYSSLPPGYETTGQRLRLLNTIQQEKFGNCIDLSLLFAACLEAVDLNPVLIIVRGHAFVGCWLQDDKFSEIINDDKAAITKRLSKGIREMAAVEATSVCKGNNFSFSEALNAGEAQLVQKEDFWLSVDVKRARTLHIRPLPLILNTTSSIMGEEEIQQTAPGEMEKTFEIGTIYQDDLLQGKLPKTKQKIWERKLLDLSLRNNLLNLHMTRNMLQLVDIDISHLEDTLSEGKSFSILPNPEAEVLRKYNLYTPPLHPSSPLFQLANDELKYNRLLTRYHQEDLENILTYMHKNAKQAIEENGSSTLYLAVGLLKWYDRKSPGQPRLAPVLLLPVEISRRSVNSKFTLKSREEETMINITLVEFLRQEYELNLGALEKLPADDKGVDVAKVMGTLRRAVMQLKGWDVEEQIVLGNFSFSKLILWKDIVVHQEELVKSDMVRSLVEGKLVMEGNHEILKPQDLDDLQSESLVLPIPTDVSQMEAVLTAQQGQSFVLHGPPGTGKSQTITNMIADALYHGKRVLFVAAKKAALDVVHRRLEQVGLSSFSLELHSNKSKKSEVLERLAKTLETGKFALVADYEREALRLDTAKKAISNYVNLLHQKQKAGWSLYDCITAMEKYKDKKFQNNFISPTILEQVDPVLWQQWTDWLPQFQSVTRLIIHPSENPLAAMDIPQYSVSVQEDISLQTQGLLKLLPDLQSKSQSLCTTIHFPFSIQTKTEWEQFTAVLGIIQNLPGISIELVGFLSGSQNYSLYEEWIRNFRQYLDTLNNILDDFNRSVLSADIATTEIQWKQAQQTWFLPKWLGKRKVKKQLGLFRKVPFTEDSEIEQFFSASNQLQELQHLLQQNRFIKVQQALNNLYKEEQTNCTDIDNKASLIQQLGKQLGAWETDALGKWVRVLQEKNIRDTEEVKGKNITTINELIQLAATFNGQKKDYEKLTGIHFQQQENWMIEISAQLQQIREHLSRLKNWMNYRQLYKQGKDLNLQWLLDAYGNKSCDPDTITDYFYYTVNASLAQYIIGLHEPLNLFNAGLFEGKIEQYKKIAKDFQSLTIQELRLKLAAQLPNTTVEAMQSSEIGILQRAIKSRGRGWSIRKLFDQIPALLPRIAPCMLMSPLSVAQYFDVNTKHFDMVIFDEASQLPTCEAVSALARARQSVIVGDPKQMPPTSFFTTTKVDEDNLEMEDLESILDDCLSLSVPSRYLLRHYRSRHESLIAFSNVNYYDNKLLTFPSADDLNRKVKYHHVPGFYDKGRTRTNSFEADEIVNYIRLHYSDPERRKLSLGVVTFSQAQQSLIEEKLQKLFLSDLKLEEWAGECEEPLFIKNLENVQGDERDIILFSVCYAPDEEGKMTMNFGPLNRNGGWRRLNVAVTRARYEMHLFASLKADQVDLNRTSAEGVAGLKAFLEFAENGHLSIRPDEVQEISNREHLSGAISERLREKGLTVRCNIGTSGFKIDIGIVDPDKPQKYILGIVIDGYYYLNAHTTNDREMVMPAVLKALGWNIHRIWTIDWYENADQIIDAIVDRVKQLQSQPDSTEAPVVEQEKVDISEPIRSMSVPTTDTEITGKQKPYKAQSLASVHGANSETIYEFQNRNVIKQQLLSLVNTESPVSKSLLFKKLLQAWNISRAGNRLIFLLDGIIKEMNLTQTMHHQPFYWADNNTTLDYYRNNEIEKRSIEDIAPEEILVALREVIQHNLSIEEEELLRYLAHTFDFAKLGRQIDTQLRYVIDLAEKKGMVKKEAGRIKLSDK